MPSKFKLNKLDKLIQMRLSTELIENYYNVLSVFEDKRDVLIARIRNILRGRSNEVQDIMQEVFLAIYKTIIDKGNVISHPKTWLYRVVHNKTVDAIRDINNSTDRSTACSENDDALSNVEKLKSLDSNPLDIVIARSDLEDVVFAINQLSEKYRQVIILRVIDDMESKEVADVMGINIINVRVTLSRARALLRNIMEDLF